MFTDRIQTDPLGLRLGSEQQGHREQSQGLPPLALRESTDVTLGSFSWVLHGTYPRLLELQLHGWVLAELLLLFRDRPPQKREIAAFLWVQKCHPNASEGNLQRVSVCDCKLCKGSQWHPTKHFSFHCSLSFWSLANAYKTAVTLVTSSLKARQLLPLPWSDISFNSLAFWFYRCSPLS